VEQAAQISALTARVAELETLAGRTYPGLKASGYCSAHFDDGHFECETCYADLNKSIEFRQHIFEKLYGELLEVAGLADPPNGRLGTIHILAEIRRKLARVAELEGERGRWKEAFDDARDSVLHGRGPLEATLDSDQTNAVLGVIDDAFSAALAPPEPQPSKEGK
jgi:hypothetical protein